METPAIITHSGLSGRIAELKVLQEMQEDKLKTLFGEIVSSINLGVIFKAATTQQQTPEVAKMGLNMAVNLITGFILGKNRSIKGYLSSVMVEKFTSSIIDHNLISIFSTISSLFKKNKKDEN